MVGVFVYCLHVLFLHRTFGRVAVTTPGTLRWYAIVMENNRNRVNSSQVTRQKSSGVYYFSLYVSFASFFLTKAMSKRMQLCHIWKIILATQK